MNAEFIRLSDPWLELQDEQANGEHKDRIWILKNVRNA